jgi:hypothetical protein
VPRIVYTEALNWRALLMRALALAPDWESQRLNQTVAVLALRELHMTQGVPVRLKEVAMGDACIISRM